MSSRPAFRIWYVKDALALMGSILLLPPKLTTHPGSYGSLPILHRVAPDFPTIRLVMVPEMLGIEFESLGLAVGVDLLN